MHHFIVRDRQHEVLGIGIQHPEGHLVVVILAVHRIALHVIERVVHPAEVPFVVEPQAVGVRRQSDAGIVGGLLRQGHRARLRLANSLVGITQEGDGLQVLVATVVIRHPLAVSAAVVAINHRRHRIDPQRIDTETLQPIQRVARQVVAHLVTAVVVDQRIPVLVVALTRIGVFVQRGAVEIRQAVGVAREVPRHPVKDHVNARLMRRRHERPEIGRRAEATGRRIQPQRLIAPAAVERVLVDRQQLDMGESHVLHIVDKLHRQLAIAKPEVIIGVAAP